MTLLALPYNTLFMVIAMIAVFYLLLVRPMRKQAAAFAEKQEELRKGVVPGSRVQLNGGLFGTVTHVGDKQAIVELAPGVEVTIVKDAVAKILTPEDEEFEYADDVEADDIETSDTLTTDDTVPAAEAEEAAPWASGVDSHPTSDR